MIAGDSGPCDENCKTTIAATVGCLGAAVCLFILGWRLRKLRCQNGQNLKKYVGSLVSVSAVPSDYHDDREMYRNTLVNPQWIHKGPMEYSPVCHRFVVFSDVFRFYFCINSSKIDEKANPLVKVIDSFCYSM